LNRLLGFDLYFYLERRAKVETQDSTSWENVSV